MHRVLILLVSLVLVAAACAHDDAATSTPTTSLPATSTTTTAGEQPETTAGEQPTTAVGSDAAISTTTAVTDTRTPLPEGVGTAPDFELALGQSGMLSLSDELKPVYMVFRAEW